MWLCAIIGCSLYRRVREERGAEKRIGKRNGRREGRREGKGGRREGAAGVGYITYHGNMFHASSEVVCNDCSPRCQWLDDGLHFFEPAALIKHEFPGRCESCQVKRVGTQRGGLASSQADFIECHSCNRWLCEGCRLRQTLGACIICPAKMQISNYAGPTLGIPAGCLSEAEVEELSRQADEACEKVDTGKFSSGRWAAGAVATSERGRGPRVAQMWAQSEGRHAFPPQCTASEGEEGKEGEEGESPSYESSSYSEEGEENEMQMEHSEEGEENEMKMEPSPRKARRTR